MRRRVSVMAAIAVAAMLCGACGTPLQKPTRPREIPVAPYLENTICERAFPSGGDQVLVQGIGLVTGLNGTGSTAHAPGLRTKMLKLISQHNVPDPEQLLADPNTAAVYVSGYIPPGGRRGERFDLVVMAAPGTETTSLEGGTLLETSLARMEPSRTGVSAGTQLAVGSGELFVSPFVVGDRGPSRRGPAGGDALRPVGPEVGAPQDIPQDTSQDEPSPEGEERPRSDPRTALILGGGRCLHTRHFFLNLLEPSSRTAEEIVRHIKARFPGAARGNTNPGIIDLKVPEKYSLDKGRFLDVVGGVFMVDSPDRRDERIRELVSKLQTEQDRRGIVAALEAFGKPAVSLLEPLLGHREAVVRFYAAEALARLDQPSALGVLEAFVQDNESPFQEGAVRALGELEGGAGAAVIRQAFDVPSPAVRIAAYMTLRRVAPDLLDIVEFPGRKELAVVPTRAEPFIFISRQITPQVVIFGDVALDPPLLVDTPRLLASVIDGQTKITLIRKDALYGPRAAIETNLKLASVVAVLMAPPQSTPERPKPRGLDMSYSDVVALLDQASRKGALKALIQYEPVRILGSITEEMIVPSTTETDIVIPEN